MGRTSRLGAGLLIALFTAWTVACPFGNRDREGCLILPLFVMASYLFLLRPRVVVAHRGVVVRNSFRSHHVPWEEIDRVVLIPPHQNPLQLVKTDGQIVKCEAGMKDLLSIYTSRSSRADGMADEIARRAAVAQGRPTNELGGSSAMTSEDRVKLMKEGLIRAVMTALIMGVSSSD